MPHKNRRTNVRVIRSNNSLKGHRLTLPSHPTTFCSEPWFPLILRLKDVPIEITTETLYAAIITQLGRTFAVGIALSFRLQSLRLWGPIPTTNDELILQVSDLFTTLSLNGSITQSGTLMELSSFADQVNRAAVGFKYPFAQEQLSLIGGAGLRTLVARTVGAGTGSIMYVKLLWRPYRGTPPG